MGGLKRRGVGIVKARAPLCLSQFRIMMFPAGSDCLPYDLILLRAMTSHFTLSPDEIEITAIRAQGARADRTSTRCRTPCICASTSRHPACPRTSARLLALHDHRDQQKGGRVVIIKAQKFRSLEKNRAEAAPPGRADRACRGAPKARPRDPDQPCVGHPQAGGQGAAGVDQGCARKDQRTDGSVPLRLNQRLASPASSRRGAFVHHRARQLRVVVRIGALPSSRAWCRDPLPVDSEPGDLARCAPSLSAEKLGGAAEAAVRARCAGASRR